VLDRVHFNPATDRVFSTGDLIDRGPHNLECLALLEYPWFESVKGNHEQFFEHSHQKFVRTCWYRNGGAWAYDHYGSDEFEALKIMVTELPTAIVVGTGSDRFNIIHAQPHHHFGRMDDGVFDTIPFPELEADVMWSRELFYYPTQYAFTKGLSTTYVGHNPATMLVRAGPIYFLDRNAHRSYTDPESCLAVACHTDGVIYEFYPPLNTLNITPYADVPDMSHPDFEDMYVAYPLKPSPPT
jgi:serine/threonine protein phosphatase 1